MRRHILEFFTLLDTKTYLKQTSPVLPIPTMLQDAGSRLPCSDKMLCKPDKVRFPWGLLKAKCFILCLRAPGRSLNSDTLSKITWSCPKHMQRLPLTHTLGCATMPLLEKNVKLRHSKKPTGFMVMVGKLTGIMLAF